MSHAPPHRRGERGVALIMTLLVVTLLTILVIEFTYSMEVESHMTRNALSALQATYLARSGINILAGALTTDNSPTVDPDEEDMKGWGSFEVSGCSSLPSLELPPYWRLCVHIADESGKINFNLTRPLHPQEQQQQRQTTTTGGQNTLCINEQCWDDALRRLFQSHGIDPSVVDALSDYWLTDIPTPALGQPTPLFAPDFPSIEDVAAVFAPLRAPGAFQVLRNFTTALPRNRDLRVNINTASPDVLAALLGDDADKVGQIISDRENKPFSSVGQALQGINNPNAIRLFDVRSSFFRLEASATVNGIGKTIRALVRRDIALPPQQGAQPGRTYWSLTFLSWEKEGGAQLFQNATNQDSNNPNNFDPGQNSANSTF